MSPEQRARALTETQRTALAKWSQGSGMPAYRGVRFGTARALVTRGLLATASGLPLAHTKMACHLTPAGREALEE